MNMPLDYLVKQAKDALDRIVERYLPSWEGGAAVTAREALASLCKRNEELQLVVQNVRAKTLQTVLSEIAQELPVSEAECPRHWEAYRESWGLRRFVVKSCMGRIKKMQDTPTAANAGEVCPHNRQATTALGAITGTGWTCKECGTLISDKPAPDSVTAAAAQMPIIPMAQPERRTTACSGDDHRGGDIAAGHFKMTAAGWTEVPRCMAEHPDVVILYHATSWPARKPTAKGAA